MRKTRSLTPVLAAALILTVAGILTAVGPYATFAKGPNDPATECLIQLQSDDATAAARREKGINITGTVTCVDGAACDADGATNGSCTIAGRACVNVPGVTGCTAQTLKQAKVNPKKLGISVTPSGTSSVCGAFTDVVLKLKKKGKKPSKKQQITAIGKAEAKGAKDVDKAKVQCLPCPTESCVPPTTTTTTTTNTPPTTLPTPPCGNGTVDAGEACDGTAEETGCATSFCNADCTACQANCTQLAFRLGAPTEDCGFPGAGAPASAPLSGVLQDASNEAVTGGDLGLGCLYIGGGQATIVPPGPTPNGSTTLFSVADCSQNALTLSGADTGNARTCTVGPSTTSKHCVNGHPGTDGQGLCTQDSDCQPVCVDDTNGACDGDPEICHCRDGAPGLANKDAGTCSIQTGCIDTNVPPQCGGGDCGTCSGDATIACGCNLDCKGRCKQNGHCGVSSAGGSATSVCLADPTCFFGSPLPINNSGTSTCVLNVIDDGAGGTADVAAGSANVTIPLKSWVYLTGVDQENFATGNACPICDNGVCNAGPRKGLSCNTNSTLKVTHDCPPPDFLFLAPLDVALSPLASEVVSEVSDGTGIFCPPSQATGGAFGITDVRRIVQNGSPAVGGLDGTFKDATLASIFCIPATNNILIDNSANLPGPGSVALGGSVRLQ